MLQATPSKFIMHPGNTELITLENLLDILTNTYLNAATLTATLYDDQGNKVTGCDGITLNYVVSSNGEYKGVCGGATFLPTPGTGYTLIVEGTASGGVGDIHIEYIVEIKARQT